VVFSQCTYARAAVLLLGLASLAGCDDKGEYSDTLAACPKLTQIQNDYGATIGGKYGGASLDEYQFKVKVVGDRNLVVVLPPSSDRCVMDIANRLSTVCDLCERSPDSCLNIVGSAMNLPTSSCSVCGDNVCSGDETRANCENDCRCGNDNCEAAVGENVESCPSDCRGGCGDGYCAEPAEACSCEGLTDCEVCEVDCCRTICGDRICSLAAGENIGNCEPDCGLGGCGDGLCIGETLGSCPSDCTGFTCGDSVCNRPENCFNCPEDCAGIPPQEGVSSCLDGICSECEMWECGYDCRDRDWRICLTTDVNCCGNEVCEGDENPANCPTDCPWGRGATCGDGACDPSIGESFSNCGQDCEFVAFCGDGLCTHGEYLTSCVDCANACDWDVSCVPGLSYCGPMTAVDGVDHETLVSCAQAARCAHKEPCEGRCQYGELGAGCVDCPAVALTGTATYALCGVGEEPTCLGPQLLQTCVVDEVYSSNPACAVRQTHLCGLPCGTDANCPIDLPTCNPATGWCENPCPELGCSQAGRKRCQGVNIMTCTILEGACGTWAIDTVCQPVSSVPQHCDPATLTCTPNEG